jgi:hypothetical protein
MWRNPTYLPEIGDGIPGLSVDVLGEYGFIHLYTRHWKDHVKWLAQAIMTRPERRLAGVRVPTFHPLATVAMSNSLLTNVPFRFYSA